MRFYPSRLFFIRPCLVLLWMTSWRHKPSDSLHLSCRGFYPLLPSPCCNTKAPQQKVSSGKKIKTQPDHGRYFMKPAAKDCDPWKRAYQSFKVVVTQGALRDFPKERCVTYLKERGAFTSKRHSTPFQICFVSIFLPMFFSIILLCTFLGLASIVFLLMSKWT